MSVSNLNTIDNNLSQNTNIVDRNSFVLRSQAHTAQYTSTYSLCARSAHIHTQGSYFISRICLIVIGHCELSEHISMQLSNLVHIRN